jgi:isopenicillin-N N-acyltransferase-like protein
MSTSPSVVKSPAQSGVHHVYEWSGSAYEIGRQHGEALRAEIIQEFAPALRHVAEVLGWSEARVLDRHRALYEPVFTELVPRAIEEIRGLAHGAQLSYEQAFFAATRDGAGSPPPSRTDEGCTAFFCGRNTTHDGRVLIGQTKDTGAPLSRYRITKLCYDDGLSAISLNYPGWLAHVGLSSNGLANTGNSLYAQPPSEETMPFSLLKRLVLESNTIEGVLTATARLCFENGCLLVGGSGGEGACIEFVAGRRAVFDISQQAFGHANSILDPELQAYESRSKNASSDTASSAYRQRTIQRRLDEKRGGLDVDALKSIVSDHHEYPHSICRHAEPGESRTTAAFIADPTARAVHLCIGNPCTAPFREYSL